MSGRPTSRPAPAPTSAEAARRFAEALARDCAVALGRLVAAMILHGSLTPGDYLPGRSDLDLLMAANGTNAIGARDACAPRMTGLS